MNRFFCLVGAMSLSMSALAMNGSPNENSPPGTVRVESKQGANIYYLGKDYGFVDTITIDPGNSDFRDGTIVQIENKGDKPTTVKSVNTDLKSDLVLPGEANLQFKFNKAKRVWESQGVRKYSDSLPAKSLPSGQQSTPPASE